MTKDQEKALHAAVMTVLSAREIAGVSESQADFMAGAMSVINHLFPHPDGPGKMSDVIPPVWILYPMAGRSLTEEESTNV
jgi:hypothetical protein